MIIDIRPRYVLLLRFVCDAFFSYFCKINIFLTLIGMPSMAVFFFVTANLFGFRHNNQYKIKLL